MKRCESHEYQRQLKKKDIIDKRLLQIKEGKKTRNVSVSEWNNNILKALNIELETGDLKDFFEDDVGFDEEDVASLDFFYQADYDENDILDDDFFDSVADKKEKAFYCKLIKSKEHKEKKVDIASRVFDEHPLFVTSEALYVSADGVTMGCGSDLLVIEMVEDIFVVVIEDKAVQHHNGLCQIAGELLACAQYNDEDDAQYLYAIRFIGHYVTFFYAEITPDILEAYSNGEKPSDKLTIQMFPDNSILGLNLMNHADRSTIIETLGKMKVQILRDNSSDASEED